MKKLLIFTLLSATLLLGAVPRELSFYIVEPLSGPPPVIDGKLDEAVWRKAAVFSNYLTFNRPLPEPGKIRTEFRMLYDNRGIYLGIVNFEPHPEKLQRRITDFDNENIWRDDCAELFFDARANGISYHCFKINCIGTRMDFRRMDAAVYQTDWSGTGWTARTAIEKDRWNIEAFFPWSDLPEKADVSDLWMFCHVRFAYTSGNFIGVTSSLLGGYSNPRKFGYLYFKGKNESVTAEKIAARLGRSAEEPWGMQFEDTLILRQKGVHALKKAEDAFRDAFGNLEAVSRELERIRTQPEWRRFHAELNAMKQEQNLLRKQKERNFYLLQQIFRLEERYRKLKWKIALEETLN